MLHELLGISLQEKRIISICGGGGKTSLMYALARESGGTGKTAVFTTTNIFIPEEPDVHWLHPFDAETAEGIWNRRQIVSAGLPLADLNKLAAPEEEVQEWLIANSDGIYVEADGSKRLPLKYPAEWEPVPLGESTDIVVVAGLSALGKPRCEVVHRAALAEEKIGYCEDHVTESGLAKLLWAGYGQFNPVFCLNQADTEEQEQRGARVAEELLSLGARRVVVLSLRNLVGA